MEARREARRRKRQRDQFVVLGITGAIILLAGVVFWYFVLRNTGTAGILENAYSASGATNPAPTLSSGANPGNTVVASNPTASNTTSNTASSGASSIPAQQRNKMYKSAPAMQIDVNKSYRATIETAKGNIVVDLFPKDAPQHVNNFVFLARDGFYNGLTFHRVEPGFVIQGGDPLGNGTGGPGYNIPPEIKGKHTKGALAMARRGGPPQTTPSSGSQFYITLAATPHLDGAYTVFGQTTPETIGITEQIKVGDVINKITIEEK